MNKPKLVLIRLDKIGDLISTLPVDQSPHCQDFDVHWVIAKGLGFITKNSTPKRNFIELDKNNKWQSFKKLLETLNLLDPEILISFQAPWWANLAGFLARIKKRVGVYSQWHSFLFLNSGLRQKRSHAIQHEADYNDELLHFALEKEKKSSAPILKLKANDFTELHKRFPCITLPFVVVHPGMAGSARNWPTEYYVELIEELIKNYYVTITGTTTDEKWLAPLRIKYSAHRRVSFLQDSLKSTELLELLKAAHAVVAPSTGIIHLAASLGTKSIGIYSPIQVQHPQRWQARGENVKIILPDLKQNICPAQFKCLGPACSDFDCMKNITVNKVLSLIENN